MTRSLTGAVLFGCSIACGSNMGRPVAEFPSKAELARLAAQPARPKSPLKTLAVDTWQLSAKVPPPGAPYPNENHWDALLVASVGAQQGGTRASAELRCAAEEVARFYVQNAAYPDDSLRNFLLGRCGGTLANSGIQVLFIDVAADTSEAMLESSLERPAREMLAQQLSKGRAELGLGFARGNGRATLVAMSGEARVRLQGFSPLVTGSSVSLRGEVLKNAGFVTAFVTHGAYGVKLCEPDRSLRLPAFRLECPLLESDETSRIEIATGSPEQILMHLGARLVVRHSETAGLTYRLRPVGSTEPARDAAAFRSAILEGLNQARAESGLPALALEPAQSSTNERLVPHFFESVFAGNEEILDRIGLGLLAGWDVNGMIRSGSIYSSMAESTRSPGRYLAEALDSPFGRWVLLEPGMTRVAIGAGPLEPSGLMALITTYAFFESQDHTADETAVYTELAKVRQARGLPPLRRLPSEGLLKDALDKVARNALRSDEALNYAMQEISRDRQRRVRGYVLETSDLQHVQFPEEFLGGAGEVEIGVTHYRAPGGAWGQYVILFVLFEGAPSRRSARPYLAAPDMIQL